MFTTFLTLGMAALAIAAPTVDPVHPPVDIQRVNMSTVEHLPLAPIRWHAPKELGNITFEGTHHEILQKIKDLNPYWLQNVTANETGHFHADGSSIMRRDFPNYNPPYPHPPLLRTSLLCDNGFPRGGQQAEWTNIDYIRTHYGPGMCEAMPRSCGRFACNWGSSFLMCNDQNVPAIVPCSDLYWNGRAIYSACLTNYWQTIEGQAFYINPSYNVLLKGTDPGKNC